MSIFHIAPAAHFYNYIQLESQEVRDTSVGGIVCYNGTTDYGALYVSVPNNSSTYKYRALVDEIVGGTGISVTQDEKDKGKWTIATNGNSGETQTQAVKVTIQKKDILNGTNTVYYANVNKDTSSNGFTYRAYDDSGNNVVVSVYTYSYNPQYVAINLDSSDLLPNVTTVNIDIIVGTVAAATASVTTTTPPSQQPGQQPGTENIN